MEPISTALMAVSAASASIKFLKERISDCQDVREVFGHVTRLMDCEKAINSDQAQHSSVGEITLKSTIDHGIEKRLIREALHDAKMQIDLRFGPGTYQSFIDEHSELLRVQKQKRQQAMREAARKSEELEETLKTCALVAFVCVVALGLLIFLFAAIANSAEEIIL